MRTSSAKNVRPLILVTGASGYVGGRLVAALEERGARVRCLARRPELLAGRFAAATEVMAGDLLEPASLPRPLAGVATAYYLVHSLGSRGAPGQWEHEEERTAAAFAAGGPPGGGGPPPSRPPARPAWPASSTSAGWRTAITPGPRPGLAAAPPTCAAGSAWGRCCARPASRPWNFAPPS